MESAGEAKGVGMGDVFNCYLSRLIQVSVAVLMLAGGGILFADEPVVDPVVYQIYCVTPDATGGKNGQAWVDGAGDEGPMTIDEAYGAYTNGGYGACAILLKTGTYTPTARLWVRSGFIMSGGLAGVDNHTKSAPDAKSVLDGRGVVDLVNVERIPADATAYFRGIEFRRAYATAFTKKDVNYHGVNYTGAVDIDGCRFADNAHDYAPSGAVPMNRGGYASAIIAFADTYTPRTSSFRCANTIFDGNVSTNCASYAPTQYWNSTLVMFIMNIGATELTDCQFVTNGIPFTQQLGTPPEGAPKHALYPQGAAALVELNGVSSLSVCGCRFVANRVNTIAQNSFYQPMIYARQGDAPDESWRCAFTNCLFVGNEMTQANRVGNQTVYINSRGILLCEEKSTAANPVEVINCTFAYNIVNCINTTAGLCLNTGALKVRNSILYSNRRMPKTNYTYDITSGSDFYILGDGTADIDYTLFTSTDETNVCGAAGSTLILGDNIYTCDPQFVSGVDDFSALITTVPADTVIGDKDTIGFTPDDATMAAVLALDVHTTGQQFPMVDGGDVETPVGDEPIPNGGRVNLGCYGGTAEAETTRSGGQPAFQGGVSVTFPYGTSQPHVSFTIGGTGEFSATASLYWSTNGVDYAFYDSYVGLGYGDVFDRDLFMSPAGRGQTLGIRVVLSSFGAADATESVVQIIPYDRDPAYGHGGGSGIVHFRASAHGDGSGSDWFNAKTNFAAIADVAGVSADEIWVAGDWTLNAVPGVVTPSSDVVIRGGFSGQEDSLSARSAEGRSTVDGQHAYPTMRIDNAAGRSVVLDGFRFTHSYIQGLYKTGVGDISVYNCDFEHNNTNKVSVQLYPDNHLGSGAYISGSGSATEASVSNCTFRSGKFAEGSGDGRYYPNLGLCFRNLMHATLDDSHFLTNGTAISADYGTPFSLGCSSVALCLDSAPATVRNCEFRGNRYNAKCHPNARYKQGGIVAVLGSSSGSAFTNCLFIANIGEPTSYNGTWRARQNDNPDDRSDAQGVVRVSMSTVDGTVDFMNCTFAGNLFDAALSPASINVIKGTVGVSHCLFEGNVSSPARSAAVGHEINVYADGTAAIDWSLFDHPLDEAVTAAEGGTVSFGGNVRCLAPRLATSAADYASLVVTNTGSDGVSQFVCYDYAQVAERLMSFSGHLRGGCGYYDERTGELVTRYINRDRSPAIDAGNADLDYSREPNCQQGWHGKCLNLGAYGNTPWATMTVYPGGMVILR